MKSKKYNLCNLNPGFCLHRLFGQNKNDKLTRFFLSGLVILLFLFSSCAGENHAGEEQHAHEEEVHHGNGHHEDEGVHFSSEQFVALAMEVGELPMRNLSSLVEANGQLEVPPQNEATVTAIMGATVTSIQVIEGDEVRKGQVLAYLSHPNLTRLQSDYLEAHSSLQYLEQEFQRQKRLYEEEVGSGKNYQQTQADYRSQQAMVKSLEAQLRQLGMNPSRLRDGNFYDQVPVVSPIEGAVTAVEVKTGQYVQPEKELFEVVNTHHIHADLMVFEKDIYKVEEGQQVRFSVETLPGQELYAEIYSVGKKFEQNPKAVHIHAEIENSTGKLIPGMYIQGEVLTDSVETYALPEEAIASEGDGYIAFLATKEMEGESESWMFTPVAVITGTSSKGWVAVKFMETLPENALFAINNAYYLVAEMQKGEAGHSH
ncbi:cobalt-zinc-cadmium efflux system membrane fusion protein [Catalinimonas alkaloidigena]|uniref:efflux RND transporter periplasmic adaptor subunit n=1 Tax=Catalinimonas alkaloidigena TaxID=1075417 RepID=UPI002406080D|nr:efflux RND transporter periplasmic adaptor subunit [Catalinimonas alkaloidigena]MDF9795296.1 cobalt-zinc-cadmium efflux system membrane fusion protein [Catalinimonas alkaloidigena]